MKTSKQHKRDCKRKKDLIMTCTGGTIFPLLLILFLTAAVTQVNSQSDLRRIRERDSSIYTNFEVLDRDGRFTLQWMIEWDLRRIMFEATVATRGYIGFGLSSDGRMNGADIVIGGVMPNGTMYFTDRHGKGNQEPTIDQSQDWQLHEAEENATHTTLVFSRPLFSCDTFDYQINEYDTVTLIWSFGRTDNPSQYHVGNRGQYSVHLMAPNVIPRAIKAASFTPGPPSRTLLAQHNLKLWTITSRLRVPPQETLYYCTIHQAPRLRRKHHIVGFQTRLETPDAIRHTHHILLYRCQSPPNSDPEQVWGPRVNSSGEQCYFLQMPQGDMPTQYCSEITYVFGIGGRIMFYPDHVGQALGESQNEYYLLQVHYDNPTRRTNLQYDVNIDVYYTDQLRENELGILMVGHQTPGSPSILVPPDTEYHEIFSYCPGECTDRMFPRDGVNVFMNVLHTHYAGRSVRVRQTRREQELPWIGEDSNFDPFFQHSRVLNEEVNVRPGDQITTRCGLSSTDANGTVTGGFATNQEMCLAFLYFYNRLREDYSVCRSEITDDFYQRRYLGVTNSTWNMDRIDVIALQPPRLANRTLKSISDTEVTWTPNLRQELQEDHKTYPQSVICPRLAPEVVANLDNIDLAGEFFEARHPVDIIEYSPPERTCTRNKGAGALRNGFSTLGTSGRTAGGQSGEVGGNIGRIRNNNDNYRDGNNRNANNNNLFAELGGGQFNSQEKGNFEGEKFANFKSSLRPRPGPRVPVRPSRPQLPHLDEVRFNDDDNNNNDRNRVNTTPFSFFGGNARQSTTTTRTTTTRLPPRTTPATFGVTRTSSFNRVPGKISSVFNRTQSLTPSNPPTAPGGRSSFIRVGGGSSGGGGRGGGNNNGLNNFGTRVTQPRPIGPNEGSYSGDLKRPAIGGGGGSGGSLNSLGGRDQDVKNSCCDYEKDDYDYTTTPIPFKSFTTPRGRRPTTTESGIYGKGIGTTDRINFDFDYDNGNDDAFGNKNQQVGAAGRGDKNSFGQIDNSKYSEPIGNSKYTNPFGKPKDIKPIGKSKYTNPIDNSKYVDPIDNSKYVDPIDNSKYVDPIDNSKYVDPIDNSKYTEPIGNSKYIDPVDKPKYTEPIGNSKYTNPFGKPNKIETTDKSKFTDPIDNSKYSNPFGKPKHIEPTDKLKFADPIVNSKYANPVVNSKYTNPFGKPKHIEPTDKSKFIDPIDNSKYTNPVVNSKYTNLVVNSKYTNPVVNSKYTNPFGKPKYIEPTATPTRRPPSNRRTTTTTPTPFLNYGREIGMNGRIEISLPEVFPEKGKISLKPTGSLSFQLNNDTMNILSHLRGQNSSFSGEVGQRGVISFTIVPQTERGRPKGGRGNRNRYRSRNKQPAVVDLGTITSSGYDPSNLNQNNIDQLQPFGGAQGGEENNNKNSINGIEITEAKIGGNYATYERGLDPAQLKSTAGDGVGTTGQGQDQGQVDLYGTSGLKLTSLNDLINSNLGIGTGLGGDITVTNYGGGIGNTLTFLDTNSLGVAGATGSKETGVDGGGGKVNNLVDTFKVSGLDGGKLNLLNSGYLESNGLTFNGLHYDVQGTSLSGDGKGSGSSSKETTSTGSGSGVNSISYSSTSWGLGVSGNEKEE